MAFRYRADQVGSLLRPKDLLEAHRTGVAGDKLKGLEDQHILRALSRQKDLGFKITLPSANQFPAIAFRKGITDKVYPTHFDLLWDIVPIIKSEIQALVKDG